MKKTLPSRFRSPKGKKTCDIAVAELATGKTNVFKETPSENCFGPVWSPDGSQILFEIFVDRASIAGGKPRLMMKNAADPSLSRE